MIVIAVGSWLRTKRLIVLILAVKELKAESLIGSELGESGKIPLKGGGRVLLRLAILA